MSHALLTVTSAFFSLVGAVFIIWIFWRSLKRSEDPARLVFKWVLTAGALWLEFGVALPSFARGGIEAMFGLAVAMIAGLFMTVVWRHAIVDLIANPLASLYDGGKEPPEPKPAYSAALGRRQKGHYLEATIAVREQLAKFPNDFEGVMLLARIQAEDMKDLSGAEMTLNHFCIVPEAPALQVSAALTTMADWYLKIGQDVDSARDTLKKISERFPDSVLAAQAAQRIAHLEGTDKILAAVHDRQAVAVPAGVNNLGLLNSTKFLIPADANPESLATAYVRHLEQHPQDTEARENLAIVYARGFQRLDLARSQLEQLINEPTQPVKRVAHWLNLLADLQIHGGADYDTVRGTLLEIMERFPGLPAADLAQSRLNLLKLELKGQEKETPGVKLGVYEQNIGLKYGLPRQL